jgi:hypothetical protein
MLLRRNIHELVTPSRALVVELHGHASRSEEKQPGVFVSFSLPRINASFSPRVAFA